MEHLLPVVIAVLVLVILVLMMKIHFMRKSAREIGEAFGERLASDTNTLIDISSRDRKMRYLANAVNEQLRLLRVQRLRYQQGDRELKNAVTNLSHDLRTPLTAICGYLDLLEKEEKTEAAARYLDVIRERAETMTRLTEELFRYSIILSARDGTPERVDVNALLEESVAASYAAFQETGIEPHIQMPEERVYRTLDRSALSRVFSNLLSNALKYSGGDLEIFLTGEGTVTFSNAAPGLDHVQVERLFERFYTVEAARSSTGLGLAIARTLMEHMGGGITARYEDHRLTICIRLP